MIKMLKVKKLIYFMLILILWSFSHTDVSKVQNYTSQWHQANIKLLSA